MQRFNFYKQLSIKTFIEEIEPIIIAKNELGYGGTSLLNSTFGVSPDPMKNPMSGYTQKVTLSIFFTKTLLTENLMGKTELGKISFSMLKTGNSIYTFWHVPSLNFQLQQKTGIG